MVALSVARGAMRREKRARESVVRFPNTLLNAGRKKFISGVEASAASNLTESKNLRETTLESWQRSAEDRA